MNKRRELGASQRWVIKFGSSLVTKEGCGLNHPAIEDWMRQVALFRQQQRKIVLVSSGAVAEGMNRLGWTSRPDSLHDLQAAAAVGQMGLVRAYEAALSQHGHHSAQILLTHEGLTDRSRYLNARTTLRALLDLGVIPVVNENDTVSTRELQLGDNDTLASLVANLIEADLMVILTDQSGLFDKNPSAHPDANLIEEAWVDDSALDGYAGQGQGRLGRGGMRTKVQAARIAAHSGTHCLIADGTEPDILFRIAQGEACGTLLSPRDEPLSARRQWIGGLLRGGGCLRVDAGAERALRAGKSLLPVGVTDVEGSFRSGDVVRILTDQGHEIARGIVNYADDDARRIQGRRSGELGSILGVVGEPEIIHRDNLCPLWETAGT